LQQQKSKSGAEKMDRISNSSRTQAGMKNHKLEVIRNQKGVYSKALGLLLSGFLITACSSVPKNEEDALADTSAQQEESVAAKSQASQEGSQPQQEKRQAPQEQSQAAQDQQSTAKSEAVQVKPEAQPTAGEAESAAATAVASAPPKTEPTPAPSAATAAAVATTAATTAAAAKVESAAPVPEKTAVESAAPAQDPNIAAASIAAVSTKDIPKDAMAWVLEKNWDPKKPNRCKASSPSFQVLEHGYSAQVWLDVIDHQLYVNTTIHLDIEKAGVGVKVGNGPLEKFSSMRSETSAIWSGDLVSALKANETLEIVIGGDYLGDLTQSAQVQLDGLRAIYPKYLACKD
jgi:hypothetical protein